MQKSVYKFVPCQIWLQLGFRRNIRSWQFGISWNFGEAPKRATFARKKFHGNFSGLSFRCLLSGMDASRFELAEIRTMREYQRLKGFTDNLELRRRNRATVEHYMR
ncbi:PhzA/PhzB family protein, partial [Pseudomonas aeruginosa]|uniref:PhzA/PhzB family protein n=1 Tax=Pseudomonas aeruginosa TaxID=287 RepID=UPI002E1708CA